MIIAPFSRPFTLMAKPVGARCNLACTYCYYLEKSNLSRGSGIMSDETLETFIRQYIEAQSVPVVQFTWHGGEPLMRNIGFFQKALKLQQQYAAGHIIENSLQTNGTLLDDEWCRLLADNRFLVGISIDGPRHQHDAFRKTKRGGPSFNDVMRGIELLNRHHVEWNALATVNSANADEPRLFYEFFRGIGCQYLQFTPIVERAAAKRETVATADSKAAGHDRHTPTRPPEKLPGFIGGGDVLPYSVRPEQWGRFLCEVFDLWVRRDVGSLFVQLFDSTLANWVGEQPGVCTLSTTCANGAIVETDGSIYACDHFVFPEYKLGNLHSQEIASLIYGQQHQQFARQKTERLSAACRRCKWLFACNGECPRNRFLPDTGDTDTPHDGTLPHEPQVLTSFTGNYLCEGYRMFFEHTAPYMQFMAEQLRQQQPPANVMKLFK